MLYAFALGGIVLSLIFGIHSVVDQRWYALATATLLAIGLYSSTYGIALQEARRHFRLILSAVTVGVLLKALIIGAVMSLVLRSPFGFVLGIIVAQIDPLSTAALQSGRRLSARARTILAAWSSFDDPVTVILSLYVPVVIAMLTGLEWHAIGGTMQDVGLGGYLAETGLNLAFAGAAFVLWTVVRRYVKVRNYVVFVLAGLAAYGLLLLSFSVAIYFFWMLGIAVIGLFMRPAIEKVITHMVQWALCLAATLLGVLLAGGINLATGLALGLAAYGSQIVVGYLLCRRLSRKDRLHISLAQQNGITAIILALLFEPYYSGTIAIVGPAVLIINSVHYAANHILDVYVTHDQPALSLREHAERLRAHFAKM